MHFSLATPRLVITHLIPEDAIILSQYRSRPEVSRLQSWQEFSVADAENLIEEMQQLQLGSTSNWYQLGIRHREENRLIGDIGMCLRQNGPAFDAELGYSLDPLYQKQGYMLEALGCFIEAARETFRIRRFLAATDPRNLASIRLLDRLSFQREALFIKSCWFKGEWADDAVYVLHSEA